MSSPSAAAKLDPLAASPAPETCPLCQATFDPSCAGPSCGGCPLARGCASLTCPSCGYSFPRPTGLSAWLARAFARRRERTAAPTAGALTLCDLPTGQRAQVTGMDRRQADRLSKLAAFGIVEGCELRIRQRHPAFIIDVGETTLALDGEVAEAIQVAPLAG